MRSGDLHTILATDCGSTTTKAILVERLAEGFRLVARGEAPTTVEAPVENVTNGVLNALGEIEDQTDRRFVRDGRVWCPRDGEQGCDAYVSTSSAGGGLQMVVAGVVTSMSAESAQRAALGAGAIVIDTLAINDGRTRPERIERLRALRPDIVLLAGGTDGGTVRHVAELAELIAAADPQPRFGYDFRLPVVYAGNRAARDEVQRILGTRTTLHIADNLRPGFDWENLLSARERIHELFLEHVMKQAPGYDRLMSWTTAPLMPTPAAVGRIMQLIAARSGVQIVGVDIGGATTDVFSVFRSHPAAPGSPTVFNRTVSANLGLSYSICNVVAEAGLENVLRWVPLDLDPRDVRDRIRNKMIRPTTIPQTLDDLLIEQAVCREALRLAFRQHRAMAVGLRGVSRRRAFADALRQDSGSGSLVDLLGLDLLVGSGGVLSHSPRRVQAALLLIDGLEPEGFTELAVDSIFMMPQLGVLSTLHEEAAVQVFHADCLVRLGWCIAPRGVVRRDGRPCMSVEVRSAAGMARYEARTGQMLRVPLGLEQRATVIVAPARGFDVGAGPGRAVSRELHGGVVGLILDGRGRPLALPQGPAARRQKLAEWNRALDAYPVG